MNQYKNGGALSFTYQMAMKYEHLKHSNYEYNMYIVHYVRTAH